METYVLIMYSLSSFGFIIIFVSLYLLLTVSTKMTPFTRFVIHAHDLSSAITQLYMTLGTVPVLLLPCASGYANGFFTQFGIMNSYNQAWSQFLLLSVSSSFSLLLPINRTFAVSQSINKWKNIILSIFFSQASFQVVGIIIVGINLKDGGERAKLACIKRIKSAYPIEMYTLHGLNFVSSEDIFVAILMIYVGIFTVLYVITSSICGVILIHSIRNLKKNSQSSVFLTNQRKMTVGILCFVLLELFALGIPFVSLAACLFFSLGNTIVGELACFCICIYPIFGPYYVLMSNADYRRRFSSIIKRAYEKTRIVKSVGTTVWLSSPT